MIYLREINKTDISTLNKWRNDKEIIDTLGSVFRYINEETDLNWFENYMRTRTNNVRLAICTQGNDALVGVVNLTNIDWQNRNAEFSIMIGEKTSQGKGYGTEATTMMIKHCFENLNLHRLYLHVLDYNTKAIDMYKKVGFKEEGKLKQCIYKNNKYHDMLVMGLVQEN